MFLLGVAAILASLLVGFMYCTQRIEQHHKTPKPKPMRKPLLDIPPFIYSPANQCWSCGTDNDLLNTEHHCQTCHERHYLKAHAT